MRAKIALITSILIGLGLLVVSFTFFLKTNKLKRELSQATQMTQKMQEEMGRLEAESERIAKENEKFYADAVSYITLNTKLRDETRKLQKSLQETQKTIQTKEGDLQRQKQRLEQLEKKLVEEQAEQQDKLLKESEEFKKKIDSLEGTLKREKGLYYYNLGVAYTQAEFYDEAIAVYEKLLEFNPNNPEAHYNLGLLYEKVREDSEKASLCYRKYLELKPDAEDIEEVEGWIERLKY